MRPSTIMTILALKLHVGYEMHGSEIAEMINVNEDNAHVQHRHKCHVIKIKMKKPIQFNME